MKYILLVLTLVGCATTAKYEAMLETWRGDDANNLVMKWGVPDKQFTMPNGLFAYEYHYDGGVHAHAYRVFNDVHMDSNSRWCITTFFIDGAKIINWQWRGNECRSR